MKRFFILLLALAVIALSASCSNSDTQLQEQISGKVFIWEKEGFGGDFSISLNDDGTYSYYVGYLSSYFAVGDWTVKDGILTLNEESMPDTRFQFEVKDRELIFISDGSSDFMYVSVENGDRFLLRDT